MASDYDSQEEDADVTREINPEDVSNNMSILSKNVPIEEVELRINEIHPEKEKTFNFDTNVNKEDSEHCSSEENDYMSQELASSEDDEQAEESDETIEDDSESEDSNNNYRKKIKVYTIHDLPHLLSPQKSRRTKDKLRKPKLEEHLINKLNKMKAMKRGKIRKISKHFKSSTVLSRQRLDAHRKRDN